ncbi:MAG TPA: CDP-diacylglycerol--serine O-phosphatidyltransferase [Verrucomicrobia bacterium]|nr:CDP-diacylglycerol--serine O-phosphatidyltransferase [Verrucomicrobiota bacterium]HOP97040.1 CDP-diacylglycerol--serine O-phosphatidyltransferase [Verrucomicrobiota bacterium]HPU56560.1 CDP-diacylglycerol--serine O-phosphatidyltransferase [Verrucomicrobiota bacterium]
MSGMSQSGNDAPERKLKIYFLPNLLTAGNLFCGFVALTKIVEANIASGDYSQIKVALGFILLACIFDLFDGRVARMGGVESPFGREFDSLADLVSFGVAPAFLVHRVVLRDVFESHPEIGWFIASVYLLCGAFRLARFNCLAIVPGAGGGKEFLGFPIPSAAGLVASLTLLIINLNEHEKSLGRWKYVPLIVLIFLSAMMVSTVRYPSFKSLGLRSTSTFAKAIAAALVVGGILVIAGQRSVLRTAGYVLPVVFTAYLVYGFIRPRISRRIREEIEEEDEEELEAGGAGGGE